MATWPNERVKFGAKEVAVADTTQRRSTCTARDLHVADLLDYLGLDAPYLPDALRSTVIAVLTAEFCTREKGDGLEWASIEVDLGDARASAGGLDFHDITAGVTFVPDASITAHLDAAITIALADVPTLELALGGSFQAAGGVSTLALTTEPAYLVPLGALLAWLLRPFGLACALPDALAGLVLAELELGFTLSHVAAESIMPASTRTAVELRCTRAVGGATWEILPGLLEVCPTGLVVSAGSDGLFLDVQARLRTFGWDWSAEVCLPSGTGEARLDPGEHRITGLLAGLGLDDAGGLGEVSVGAAWLRWDVASREVSIHVESAADAACTIGPVELGALALDVGYRGGEGGGVSATLLGTIGVAGARIRVRASHDGPGLGWAFAGSAELADATLTVGDLGAHFGLGELPLADLALASLDLSYATQSGQMLLGCGVKYRDEATITLVVEVSRGRDGAKETRFSGHLDVHGARFDLRFSHDGKGDALVAAYSGVDGRALTLAQVIEAFGVDKSAAHWLPDVALRRALMVVDRPRGKTSTPARLALAADLDLNIDFSGLRSVPVVGECLPQDCAVGVSLRPVFVRAWTTLPPEVQSLLPDGSPSLDPLSPGLGVDLRLGGRTLSLRSAGKTSDVQNALDRAPAGPSAPPGKPQDVAWTPVNRSLGGLLDLRRVGTSIEGKRLELQVEGSVTLQALTLDLMGLGLGFDLDTRAPSFSLLGLGFGLDRPPLRISAAFLNRDGDFVGRAEIHTATFGLTAIGGFSSAGGSPSIFLYGVLDYPLGGPPFFFVEGLAAGFGVNRRLTLPAIDAVERFPLVADAVALGAGAPAGPPDLGAKMQALHDAIHPAVGEHFFAAGLKFNSFKALEGFGLIAVALDAVRGGFTLAFVGVATWSSPTPPSVKPDGSTMAWLRILMLATMSSSDSSLIVQAQLAPGCFVASSQCHLRGGVAAGFWFGGEHAGDFVYSVGGYHPAFTRPAHFPLPAALGFDWQITSGIHASGSLYYALTPRAMMFGFAFHAVWDAGPCSAWFDLALDFLMQFKPVHYDASGHLELGASISTIFGDITVHAGASLHIWGPPFSGRATAHLGPFAVSMSFGDATDRPPALTRKDFLAGFFPVGKACLSAVVDAGLLATVTEETKDARVEWWRVAPKSLVLRIESLLPLSGSSLGTATSGASKTFHAPPMEADVAAPTLRLRLHKDGSEADAELAHFTAESVSTAFPCALFQDPDDAHAAKVRALSGVRLVARPHTSDAGTTRTRAQLGHERAHVTVPRATGRRLLKLAEDRTRAARRTDRRALVEHLRDTDVRRRELLADLQKKLGDPGLDPALLDLNPETLVDSFLEAPRLAERVIP